MGTFTCGAQMIDKDNYQILVDNGTYTEDEIAPRSHTDTGGDTCARGNTCAESDIKDSLRGRFKRSDTNSPKQKINQKVKREKI